MKLLIGGSPCTHWSIAQTKDRETEPAGLGWELFLNFLVAKEKYRPDFFLYENNKSMSTAIRAQITRELGVEPILINSALVSGQSRQRLYWTNIPGVTQPEDKGILLGDVLESGIPLREKGYTLKANYGRGVIGTQFVDDGHFPANGVAEPVRVGDMPNREGKVSGSQSKRIYSAEGKSVPLQARPNGGGADGASTGLYAVPAGMAWRGRGGSSSYEVRSDQKANAVTADGHQSRLVITAPDGKDHQVYEVKDGQIEINGKKYPIRLPDGFYIIRKLTVTECKRLQTVPEWYVFPVSDTQAYKMLGNGWTVDVIAHVLSFCPGLKDGPVEVLSMYDGMSCGRLALQKLGVNISRYYATEIDKYAISTTQKNFPDTIQIGDAFQVRETGWTIGEGAKGETDMNISDIVTRAHDNAVKHGFWDPPLDFGTAIALIHSELSEALEEKRAGRPDLYFPCNAGGVCVDDRGEPGVTCGSRVFNPDHPDACSAKSKKPDGVAVELADAVIRIADLCGYLGIDLEAAIALKMDYNEGRPYKHGKKF